MSTENDWTDEQALDFGRRWVEACGWDARDPGGHPALFAAILVSGESLMDNSGAYVRKSVGDGWEFADGSDVNDFYVEVVPDFRDAGARGYAFDQVRKAVGESRMWQREEWWTASGKRVVEYAFMRDDGSEEWDQLRGQTDSEALLAARKAAPR